MNQSWRRTMCKDRTLLLKQVSASCVSIEHQFIEFLQPHKFILSWSHSWNVKSQDSWSLLFTVNKLKRRGETNSASEVMKSISLFKAAVKNTRNIPENLKKISLQTKGCSKQNIRFYFSPEWRNAVHQRNWTQVESTLRNPPTEKFKVKWIL